MERIARLLAPFNLPLEGRSKSASLAMPISGGGHSTAVLQPPPEVLAASRLDLRPPLKGEVGRARQSFGSRLALLALLVMISLTAIAPALAVNPDEMLKDPALEARARALSQELRCLVCQNESIDASDAALAHDIRVLLRERLEKGDTDQQAIDFLVARYGEFILLKPRFNPHTWALWLVPPGVLVIGGLVAAGFYWKRRKRPAAPAPLDAAEQADVARLMSEDG